MTPSRSDEDPYLWCLIAIGHAMVGAAMGLVFGILAGGIYWIAKERRDVARGGSLRDGLVDAGFVALGSLYGPWWWPLAVFAAVLIGLLAR